MYRISKMFSFEASHQLTRLPAWHKCSRLHGHSYRVELILSSPLLDDRGFVIDYGDLKPFQEYIDSQLDHQHLNDIIPLAPTAENIARHLYHVAFGYWDKVTIVVRVSETAKTWAEYSEEA